MQEELLLKAGRLLLDKGKPDQPQAADQIIDETENNDHIILECLCRTSRMYENNFRAELDLRKKGTDAMPQKTGGQTDEDPTDVSRKEFTSIQAVEKSDNDNFIGANALSISRMKDANVETDMLDFQYLKLNASDYLVCAKSDGMRYLLFICNNRCVYMNDRKSQFFEVNCYVPSLFFGSDYDPKKPDYPFQVEYIFDGELILNDDEQEKIRNNPQHPYSFQYLAFDTLVYKRKERFFKKYTERLQLIKTFQSKLGFYLKVSQEENEAYLQNPDIQRLPKVEFILKDFYRCNQIEFLMDSIIKKKILPHENDGLIFTKNNYPYIPGKNRGILKWKPNELNTVDFLVVATDAYATDPIYTSLFLENNFFVFELYTIYGEEFYFVDFLYVTEEEAYVELRSSFRPFTRNGLTFDGAIYECSYNHALFSYEINNFTEILFTNLSSETLENILNRCIVKLPPEKMKLSPEKPKPLPKTFEECLVYTVNRKIGQDRVMAGGWVVLRQRKDKEFPNNLNTAFNTIKAIFDSNISEEELLEAFRPDPEEPHKRFPE